MGVICIGQAVWDITGEVNAELRADRKYQITSHVESPGGAALNASCVCAKWGDDVSLVSRMGKDSYGERIADSCRKLGVNLDRPIEVPGTTTSFSFIAANAITGERTIFNFPSPEGEVSFELPETAPDVILTDGHELEASLGYLHAFPDAVSIIDAGSCRPICLEIARECDYIVSSEVFAEQFLGHPLSAEGDALREDLLRMRSINEGCQVVVTLGARGLVYLYGDEPVSMPAFKVKAVDSTGAGDIFHGAFAYGVHHGLPLEECLRLASMTSAISVTRMGSQIAIPTLDEVRARLREEGFELGL